MTIGEYVLAGNSLREYLDYNWDEAIIFDPNTEDTAGSEEEKPLTVAIPAIENEEGTESYITFVL